MDISGISLMIMYEDESVDVRYRNGAQLQLSPCGSEFLLVKKAHGHPLQPTERLRQRTRFTVSSYKELLVAALAFRNKYASRPYLPGELISADHKKPFFSIESFVQWPDFSSCEAELGLKGEIIVRSEEGQAMLALSPSGEEFSVEFTCSLSQPQKQHHNIQCSQFPPQTSSLISDDDQTEVVHQGRAGTNKGPTRSHGAQHEPEQAYQSTTVVQHHSCHSVAPTWVYPLSLARHHWTSRLFKHKVNPAEETSSQADHRINISNVSCAERRSQLPRALPLTCPSPHQHRWKYKDPRAREVESDPPTDLVKIIQCQGVTYRILSEVVPVIEISPGDGSVIRSNGGHNSYFTQHKALQSEQVKELIYHVNSLPPDVLGQMYSVCSIVSRASRILTCYNQAKQSLKLHVEPTCLQEDKHFSKATTSQESPSSSVLVEQHVNVTQTADNLSHLVGAELKKIKRFNFLLDNAPLLRGQSEHVNQEKGSTEVIHETVNEDCIAEALQRTSKAIQDIDALIAGASLT